MYLFSSAGNTFDVAPYILRKIKIVRLFGEERGTIKNIIIMLDGREFFSIFSSIPVYLNCKAFSF